MKYIVKLLFSILYMTNTQKENECVNKMELTTVSSKKENHK